MPARLLLYAVSAAIFGLLPPMVHAQTTALTGAVDGRVSDRTGAALAGAEVQLFSDALMGRRAARSSDDGSYRFGALPPGVYSVSFANAGFHPIIQSGVRVNIGETTTVNASLDVAANDDVKVTADVRALDRRTTMVMTVFDATALERLPGSRTPDAILSATPSVQVSRFDVGGSALLTGVPFSAYGIAGYNRPTLEGINVSGMNNFGVSLDYGAFEQVSVNTAAYGPEWPSPGVHLQVVTKAGGNQYRGVVDASYESGRWQSHNITDSQIARGAARSASVPARDANRLSDYHDINADVGGFIRRDRLWWYASIRSQRTSARQVAFAPEPMQIGLTAGTGKATLRVGESSRVVFFVQQTEGRQPIRLDAFLRPSTAANESLESTLKRLSEGLVWKAEWNAIVGNKLLVELRAGRFAATSNDRPNGTSPRFEDVVDPAVLGGNRDWSLAMRNNQASGSVGYVFEGPGGRHHVSAGGDWQSRVDTEMWNQAYPGEVLQVLRYGLPWEVYLFQAPSRSQSGQEWFAAFGNDSWQAGQRLTLNLGLRVDHIRVFLPEQNHPAGRFNPVGQSFPAVEKLAAWTVVAPRIAASIDVLGTGRTLVKASYGRYWLPPGTDLGFNLNPNSQVWWERYRWSDTNGNGVWNAGEQSGLLEQRGGDAVASIDPGLRLAFVREATARVEQEVGHGFGISTGVVWRGERQQGARQRASWPFEAFSVAKMVADPGPDGVPGTADDGDAIQVYDIPPELLGLSDAVVRNVSHGDSDYFTWDAAVQRRVGGRWSLLAAFSQTWQHDQASGYVGQAVRVNEFPATPNDLLNTDDLGRHAFTTWSAKVLGTYEGPWGLAFTPFLRHQSGQPFGRTLIVPLAQGAVRVLVEPVGARRQDSVTILDLRVSKTFGSMAGRRLTGFIDGYNLFNSNAEQNVSWSTSDFLRPLAIIPPRIVRVGVRVVW